MFFKKYFEWKRYFERFILLDQPKNYLTVSNKDSNALSSTMYVCSAIMMSLIKWHENKLFKNYKKQQKNKNKKIQLLFRKKFINMKSQNSWKIVQIMK